MVCLEKTGPATREELKDILLAALNLSFIDFKYIWVLGILSSWRLGSADAWPAWKKMLCMVCYMLHCTHLQDRHDKSDSFFFWFYFIIELLLWYISKTEQTILLEIP